MLRITIGQCSNGRCPTTSPPIDPDEVLDNHRVDELISTFTSVGDVAFSSTADVECGTVHSYAATNTEIDAVEAAAATRVGALESWRPRVESHASVDLFDSGDDSNELRYEEPITANNWGGLFDGDGAANAEIADDWDKPSTASTDEPSLVHVLRHGPPLLVESRLHALRVAQELGARPRAGGRARVLTGEDDDDHQPRDLGLGRAALVPVPGLHQALQHVVIPGSDGGAPTRPDDLGEDTIFDGTNVTKLPTTCSTSELSAELAMAHYGAHLPSDKGDSVASWQPAWSLALACQQASSARGTPAMASMGKMSVGDLTEADLKGKRVFVCAEIHEPPDENQNITNDILSTSCDTAVHVVKRCQRLFPLADSTGTFDAAVAARVTQMVVPSPARNATRTGSSPESAACWFPCDNKSSKQLQRGGPSLAERQQPRAMLACRAITERVKRPKEEEQAASVPEAAVVADVKGKEEYNSVARLTMVNCCSDFIIWRSLFDACCRLCKLFNCQELKLTDSQSALTLIDAQVVFEGMQQSATSVGVSQDAFNMFCSKTSSSKQVARAIFVNPEHDLYPEIFHLEQLISGKEDTANNFSRGYYTIGKGMVLVANNLGDDLLARRSEIKQPWPPPQELACLGLNIMVVSVFLATSDLHICSVFVWDPSGVANSSLGASYISKRGKCQVPDLYSICRPS
jgi:hypothetical protein